jgi:hypothetical protein
MKFLEDNEIAQWAEERGLPRGSGLDVELPDVEPRRTRAYAQGHRSGLEPAAARDLVAHLGAWDECLVWITVWGVWPSGEDWPEFYAWRGARGERRELQKAPGHLFEPTEIALLTELIELVMKNAWDAHVLCSRSRRADALRAKISHDEWYEISGHFDADSVTGAGN